MAKGARPPGHEAHKTVTSGEGAGRAGGEAGREGRDTEEEEEENYLLGSYFTATLIVSFPTNIWKRFPVLALSPDAAVAE